jgi:hypothetical protein
MDQFAWVVKTELELVSGGSRHDGFDPNDLHRELYGEIVKPASHGKRAEF